jgi:hypothetical protein
LRFCAYFILGPRKKFHKCLIIISFDLIFTFKSVNKQRLHAQMVPIKYAAMVNVIWLEAHVRQILHKLVVAHVHVLLHAVGAQVHYK